MEQLTTVLAWPVAVLTVILVAIFTFRAEIGVLIGRTKKVGTGGIETFEVPPIQPKDERKGIDEFFRTFDNPLILDAEKLILNDLKDRKIEASADREKALVRSLASTNIILHFERVHSIIWASQFALPRFLNAREEGADVSELIPFYEHGKSEFPTWYENHSFDRWLGFLQSFNLIVKQDSRVFITVAGREFLKYLVAVGRSGPFLG